MIRAILSDLWRLLRTDGFDIIITLLLVLMCFFLAVVIVVVIGHGA